MPEKRGLVSLRGAFRPALTSALSILFFFASAHFVVAGLLKADIWHSAWNSLITLMIGFFFGERSALKSVDPEKPMDDPESERRAA